VLEAHSAGTAPKGVDPLAARAMAEVGIDLSAHRSKHVDELLGLPLDLVVTVCDAAKEACPTFPGRVRHLHAGFADPPRLAASAASEEEAMSHYRRVRDEIRAFVERLRGDLAAEGTP
jgi:arsenate reductase